jgi:hypothetical protein
MIEVHPNPTMPSRMGRVADLENFNRLMPRIARSRKRLGARLPARQCPFDPVENAAVPTGGAGASTR